jgi:UDP-N-acetylmuramate dehydrogenase
MRSIPDVLIRLEEPLAPPTRFGIGGRAAALCEAANAGAFSELLHLVCQQQIDHVVIAGGTNLIVSDEGFDGAVLRFRGERVTVAGARINAEAGASLQAVVDASIAAGLQGMQTMTRIPGSLGAAVYGNAGAYGHSIQERVEGVVFTDGGPERMLDNASCEFRYRESLFKHQKAWIVLGVELSFELGDRAKLQSEAEEIRKIRDAKYPPTMRCAGSIFKNCLFNELPPTVQAQIPPKLVRDGKVPSAYFLEQVGAKGMRRGDIQVAGYHANLIYNDGAGTAEDLVTVIEDLKERVFDRFGFALEEEVQYVGFERVAV